MQFPAASHVVAFAAHSSAAAVFCAPTRSGGNGPDIQSTHDEKCWESTGTSIDSTVDNAKFGQLNALTQNRTASAKLRKPPPASMPFGSVPSSPPSTLAS